MFDRYKRKKYPAGYVDLCKFVRFYDDCSYNENGITNKDKYHYEYRSFYLQGVSNEDWTVISLSQERAMDKILKFMSEHPEARKTGYIIDEESKEKDIRLTKALHKLNINYKEVYEYNKYLDNQIIAALDMALERQYSSDNENNMKDNDEYDYDR